jgi:glucosamine 6-phosphate synthetase-like amidotransferase/phosphosugar isomerase protein
MCGILGFVSKGEINNLKTQKIILNGYLAQAERGNQSFGILAGENENKKVIKTLNLGDFFARLSKVKKDFNFAMFHHRMASFGAVKKENAHPFVAGDVCLCHNGTWHDANNFRTDFNLSNDVTDSEVIANLINSWGYERALKEISGSASLVWVDKSNNTLNFWRLSTPMVLAYLPQVEVLLYASTHKAIYAMANEFIGSKKLAGVFLPYHIIETEEEIHYQLNLNSDKIFVKKGKKIESAKAKFNFLTYSYNSSNYEMDSSDNIDYDDIYEKYRSMSEQTKKTKKTTKTVANANTQPKQPKLAFHYRNGKEVVDGDVLDVKEVLDV